MIAKSRPTLITFLAILGWSASIHAQVHYRPTGQPWTQRAAAGPDAEVPGWFYNLGITGLRAQLIADEPKALLIKHVFPKSPADGLIQAEDRIIGAGGQLFKNDHINGYGMKIFGADGPISELADALETCQSTAGKGKLALTVCRGNATKELVLNVGQKYGTFAATYPANCQKSDRILAELLQYLADHQVADGSFGLLVRLSGL